MNTRFSRNFTYNVAGSLLPIMSALVTVPLYIDMIGAARYGIISITWILLGYFGFLDFGLSRASANALGRLGHASSAERAPVLMTAFYLNLMLGVAGSLILYVAGDLLLRNAFTIPGELQQEALSTFPWIVPMLPLGMVAGVASGALESRERFLLSNTLGSLGTVLGQVLPLVCAFAFGPTLGVLVPALLLVRLFVVAVTFAVVAWLEWPIRPSRFDVGWARKLFGYGAWVSVSSLISPVLDTFDQLLIGRLLGAAAIAHYAVPMNLAVRSQILAAALARTLFPRISREDAVVGRQITTHATLALIYVFGAVCAPALIVLGPFLTLWVGQDFAQYSKPVAEILMLGAWMNGVAFMPYNQLQAQGRPDLTAKVHAVEIVPFLLALWLLISLAGLPGAALAWTLRVGVDCVALLWLARCLDGYLLRAVPALVMMAMSFALAETVPLGLAGSLAFAVPIGLAFLGFGVMLEPVLRNAARMGVAMVFTRLSHRVPG